MKNMELARTFSTLADVLEIRGEAAHRAGTCRKVARTLEGLAKDIEQVRADGQLRDLPGVGRSTAARIEQFLDTGRMDALDAALDGFPESLLELLHVRGLGPKTVGRLWREKGVTTTDELALAIEDGALDDMPRLGTRSVARIRAGLQAVQSHSGRVPLGEALPITMGILRRVQQICAPAPAQFAGPLRRMCESVAAADIVAAEEEHRVADLLSVFLQIGEPLEGLRSEEEAAASIRVEDDLRVNLHVVEPSCFGAALVLATGSEAHLRQLHARAEERGLKLSADGVFRGEERLPSATEQDVYAALGMERTPAELREGAGEVEAAGQGSLPDLIRPGDIRGDLHMHTTYSDGHDGMRALAASAQSLGYEYIALTDHSQSLTIAWGLTPEHLRRRRHEIRQVRTEFPDLTILDGTEVDILADGSLDYTDEILSERDWVIASVHSRFEMDRDAMTARIVRAASHPLVHAIGHLTGRLMGSRAAYALDVDAVLDACAEHNTALELNTHPLRLDAPAAICRRAAERGVRIVINSDAHKAGGLNTLIYGVATARRAWLRAADVLNTRPAKDLP
jgi:DNA polymerase (family X)